MKPRGETAAVLSRPRAAVRCWCGSHELRPLTPQYASCVSCSSLVYSEPYDAARYTSSGAGDFYGDAYWRQHVPEQLGLPGLEERARADLPERSVYHLERLLDHVTPGSRILEIGCGSGALTYLLSRAGFEASATELGAADFASQHFGIEVHQGTLETLADSGPFDAIVAIDVWEHLPDPLTTLEQCVERLSAEGQIFLQTPCYRGEGPSWGMLLPREHLYLFTEESLRLLVRRAGLQEGEITRSLFEHDMWCAAGRSTLRRRRRPLAGISPVARALIDARHNLLAKGMEVAALTGDEERRLADSAQWVRDLAAVRADQQAKEDLLQKQDRELVEVRRDQASKEQLIVELSRELKTLQRGERSEREKLTGELEAVRRDQAAKSELIESLSTRLVEARADQAAKQELIERLSLEIEQTRADQAAKQALVDRLSRELEEVRADQAQKEELIVHQDDELRLIRADQFAKSELIDRLSTEMESLARDQNRQRDLIERLNGELEEAQRELHDTLQDRLYQRLHALRSRLWGRR